MDTHLTPILELDSNVCNIYDIESVMKVKICKEIKNDTKNVGLVWREINFAGILGKSRWHILTSVVCVSWR